MESDMRTGPPFFEYRVDFNAIFSTEKILRRFESRSFGGDGGGGGCAEMREDSDEYYTLFPMYI